MSESEQTPLSLFDEEIQSDPMTRTTVSLAMEDVPVVTAASVAAAAAAVAVPASHELAIHAVHTAPFDHGSPVVQTKDEATLSGLSLLERDNPVRLTDNMAAEYDGTETHGSGIPNEHVDSAWAWRNQINMRLSSADTAGVAASHSSGKKRSGGIEASTTVERQTPQVESYNILGPTQRVAKDDASAKDRRSKVHKASRVEPAQRVKDDRGVSGKVSHSPSTVSTTRPARFTIRYCVTICLLAFVGLACIVAGFLVLRASFGVVSSYWQRPLPPSMDSVFPRVQTAAKPEATPSVTPPTRRGADDSSHSNAESIDTIQTDEPSLVVWVGHQLKTLWLAAQNSPSLQLLIPTGIPHSGMRNNAAEVGVGDGAPHPVAPQVTVAPASSQFPSDVDVEAARATFESHYRQWQTSDHIAQYQQSLFAERWVVYSAYLQEARALRAQLAQSTRSLLRTPGALSAPLAYQLSQIADLSSEDFPVGIDYSGRSEIPRSTLESAMWKHSLGQGCQSVLRNNPQYQSLLRMLQDAVVEDICWGGRGVSSFSERIGSWFAATSIPPEYYAGEQARHRTAHKSLPPALRSRVNLPDADTVATLLVNVFERESREK